MTMKKYIDENEVVELLVEFATLAVYEECNIQLLDAAQYFKKRTHAADVQEVKHGKWDVRKDKSGLFGICSACGEDVYFTQYGKPFDYCPFCAAKMDLPLFLAKEMNLQENNK